MKIFGYFERKDPYGHYGNMDETPSTEEPVAETHNTLNNDRLTTILQVVSGIIAAAIFGIVIAIVVVILLMMTSCSPKIIENTIVKHDTTYIQQLRHDSVYVKDSVFVHLWHEGDTVYVERDRWHTEWRDRIIHDSLYLSRRDTVRVTKTQEVAKPLSGWQWFQIWAGRLVLIALAVAAAVVVVKRLYFRR